MLLTVFLLLLNQHCFTLIEINDKKEVRLTLRDRHVGLWGHITPPSPPSLSLTLSPSLPSLPPSQLLITAATIWATLYEGLPRVIEMMERVWGKAFLDEGFADRINISLNILDHTKPGPPDARLFKM